MRRACQFKELIDQYASVRFDEVLSNQILEFQIEKAKVEDAACYRVENVVKNQREQKGLSHSLDNATGSLFRRGKQQNTQHQHSF